MIGILTFVGTQSHGACLQAYALKTVMEQNNYLVEIINYKCPQIAKEMTDRLKLKKYDPKSLATWTIRSYFIRNRYRKFGSFNKMFLGIDGLSDTIEYSKYNNIVIGSDQVWNLNLTNCDFTFFGADCPSSSELNTYAASLGEVAFPKESEDKCFDFIKRFNTVNVRENDLKYYITEHLKEKDVNLVLDPTLLLTKEYWNLMVDDKPIISSKYILIHYPDETKWEEIYKLSRKMNLEIVFITNQIKPKRGCKCLYAISPIEYLNLIKNASFVVTGSFHTLCFSLIFQKEFLCTKSLIASRNSRLSNLLELSGCTERMIDLSGDLQKIDYTIVSKRIAEQRSRSIDILMSICDGKKINFNKNHFSY